ncbi:MAG: hypothetical protein OEY28_12740 [Nitrospira sp.]|nr:hypothetical protein [Nitrospira sp.]
MSAVLADLLLRRTVGGRRLLCHEVIECGGTSKRGLAVLSLDPSALLGGEPEQGRRLGYARDSALVEWAADCHE